MVEVPGYEPDSGLASRDNGYNSCLSNTIQQTSNRETEGGGKLFSLEIEFSQPMNVHLKPRVSPQLSLSTHYQGNVILLVFKWKRKHALGA